MEGERERKNVCDGAAAFFLKKRCYIISNYKNFRPRK